LSDAGTRGADENWPFGAGLRAPEDRKKAGSNENSSREQPANQSSKKETRFSSTAGETGNEVTSPPRKNANLKRKGNGVKEVYRKVGVLQPPEKSDGTTDANKQLMIMNAKPGVLQDDRLSTEVLIENDSNKKRKTPSNSENSAEAARQPCPSQ
jgi:hypothetical protein